MARTVIAFYIEFGTSFTGGPRNLYNLVSELDRDRFEPVVITNTHSELVDALRGIGVDPVIVSQPSRIGVNDGDALRGGIAKRCGAALDVWRYNRLVARTLREHRVSLLWARNIKSVLLTGVAARRLGIPLIWDIGMEHPSRGIMAVLHGIGFRLATVVVTEGAYVAPSIFREGHLKRFGRKIRSNPTGVPRDRVHAIRRQSSNQKPPWDPFVVTSIATINQRKNQLLLLKAVGELAGEYPSLHVQLVGPITDPVYGEQLRKFVNEHELQSRVDFLGWQDDIRGILHGTNLLAVTSRVEGVPQAVLEALHACVPVLATSVGGIPEVIQDRCTGVLVPRDDLSAFTKALRWCLENQGRLAELAMEGQRLVDEIFEAGAWYRRYEKIFDDVLLGRCR